ELDDGERNGERRQPRDPLRAHFNLAGMLRRAGELPAAEAHYLLAAIESAGEDRPSNNASRASVALLCEIALAGIAADRGDGLEALVRLAAEIADGVHDAVPEAMLEAVLAELATRAQHDDAASAGIREARRDNVLR